MIDAEELYYKLRDFAEGFGFVGTHADEKLSEAAESMAGDPENQ